MSQLAVSEGQPGNREEPDFLVRRLETVRFQEEGWQEPCESRGSCMDLWERGGEIPLRDPTHRFRHIKIFSKYDSVIQPFNCAGYCWKNISPIFAIDRLNLFIY